MSSFPSAVVHCYASCHVRTAETQAIPLCSITLPGNSQNWRNLIKFLECQVEVNKNHMAAYYYVTLFIFFRSLPDLETSDHPDPSVAKTEKQH